MRINRSNYESYFIDYIDGTLPDNLVDDLLDFLNENPDLAGELSAVKSIKLEASPSTFPGKKQLYKANNEVTESFDMQAAAYLEGDLKQAEETLFLDEIANDLAKLKTLDLLQKIKLRPELTIEYPNKNELFRRKNKTIYLWATRIAALLLIFFSVWALVPRKQTVLPDNPIVEQSEKKDESLKTDFKIEADREIASVTEDHANTKPVFEAVDPQTKETQKIKKIERLPIQPVTTETQKPELIAMRSPVPDQLQPLKAQIESRKIEVGKLQLATENLIVSQPQTVTVDEYLAHKIINAPKGEGFTFNNMAKAGLNAVESLSNDRFNVERSENGKLKQIKFESRLIAFSIPFRKNR